MFISSIRMKCASHNTVSSNTFFLHETKCMDAVIVEMFRTFQIVAIKNCTLFLLLWYYADLNYLVAMKEEEYDLNNHNNRATWNARLKQSGGSQARHASYRMQNTATNMIASWSLESSGDVAPCSQVDVDRRFRGAHCLRHQGDVVGQYQLHYTVLHLRRL
jgi:hypothetical protein